MRFFVYVTLIAALLVSFVPAQAMLAATVVEPANMNGWFVVDDNEVSGGWGDFVSGPDTAPLGEGSAHFVLKNNTAGWIFTHAVTPGTKLSELSKLEYSTYVTTNDGDQAVALGINIDYDVTDANNTWQGRLVYEPYMNGSVSLGAWQTWNTILPESKWWANRGAGATACPQSAPCTWAKIKADFPNAGFHNLYGAVAFKAGSGWNTFDGNFDKFVIGLNNVDTTYDFEPAPTVYTVYVDDDWSAVPYNTDPDGEGPAQLMGFDASATVQGGVNIVASGGTVKIAEGEYTEQVLINGKENLTIEGAGEALVTIKAIPNLVSILTTGSGPTLVQRKPVLAVSNSDNVTVKNLTLDGAGTGNTNNRLFGLFYLNSSGLIDHVTAKAMRHNELSGDQGGVGIYVYNTDNVARTVTATNNTAIDYQKGGLVFNGVGLTAVVDKNIATSIGATPVIAMNGIQIGYGASATVTRNNVSGHSYINPPNPTTEWTAAGILLYEASAVVTSNVIDNNQVGVSSYKSTFTASRNYISGDEVSKYGIEQDGGTSTITANNITSNDYGVYVYSIKSDIKPYTAAATIHNNRFFNNGVGVANKIFVYPDQEATQLDALNNWWSCNEGPNDVAEDCDTTTGPVVTTTWLKLVLDVDEDHVIDGRPATLTSKFLVTAGLEGDELPVVGPMFGGKSVAFATDTGLLDGKASPVSKAMTDGTASSVLTVEKGATLKDATVSVALDNEIVEIILRTGLVYIRLPIISR